MENKYNGLEVSQIEVFPVKNPEGKLKAFVKVCLNDALLLTSIRIYDGLQGLFISFPNDTSYRGDDYRQIFYPVDKHFRNILNDLVINKYNEVLEGE